MSDLLYSADADVVLTELYRLGGLSNLPPIADIDLMKRLVRSPDELVRERAIFVFGVKMKNVALCEEFILQLSEAGNEPSPTVSALMLSIFSIGCELDISKLRISIELLGCRSDIIEDMWYVYIGFVLLTLGKIDRPQFAQYMTRAGKPDEKELAEVRRALADL